VLSDGKILLEGDSNKKARLLAELHGKNKLITNKNSLSNPQQKANYVKIMQPKGHCISAFADHGISDLDIWLVVYNHNLNP